MSKETLPPAEEFQDTIILCLETLSKSRQLLSFNGMVRSLEKYRISAYNDMTCANLRFIHITMTDNFTSMMLSYKS